LHLAASLEGERRRLHERRRNFGSFSAPRQLDLGHRSSILLPQLVVDVLEPDEEVGRRQIDHSSIDCNDTD
jgi:hypothetical protein